MYELRQRQTCRNINSSRFGRFIRLQFDVSTKPATSHNGTANGTAHNTTKDHPQSTPLQSRPHAASLKQPPTCVLAGSTCSTYLLEKSRVVCHAADERNYHIFYQLLAAPDRDKAEIWDGLIGATPDDFLYLSGGTHHTPPPSTTTPPQSSHRTLWNQTTTAMKLFRFSHQPLLDIMRALCTILTLGNLHFIDPPPSPHSVSTGGSTLSPASLPSLTHLSTLLGIPPALIGTALTERRSQFGVHDTVRVGISPSDAKDGCDALAKEIYARVFGVLVAGINESTSPWGSVPQGNGFGTIGLLDIFGFEMFDTNRFEQFCINYANERLQQKYVRDNFDRVREEYEREGIGTFEFTIADNADVVELFEGNSSLRKQGLISMLNEECITPNATDNTFVQNVKRTLGDSSRLLTDKLHERFEFGIKHFAGFVTYDANKFLQSNVDRISNDLLECACQSTNSLIRTEFTKIANLQSSSTPKHRRSQSSPGNITSHSVVSKFRSQLDALIKIVRPTETRFIRCIKPNALGTPGVTDHQETMNQLVAAGLVTAATISRATYPNKLHYHIVWERFRCLYAALHTPPHTTTTTTSPHPTYRYCPPVTSPTDPQPPSHLRTVVTELLTQFLTGMFTRADGVRVPPYTCGITAVYFRAGALERLETDRFAYYAVHATVIQSCVRGREGRLGYERMRRDLVRCQSVGRRWREVRRWGEVRGAVVVVQSWVRGRGVERWWRGVRCAVVVVQAWGKGWVGRKRYLRARRGATALQSLARSRPVHHRYLSAITTVTLLQSTVRRHLSLTHYQTTLSAVRTLQTHARLNSPSHASLRRHAAFLRARYLLARRSAVSIQSSVRGKIARVSYYRRKRALAKAFFARLSTTETFSSRAKKRTLQRSQRSKSTRAMRSVAPETPKRATSVGRLWVSTVGSNGSGGGGVSGGNGGGSGGSGKKTGIVSEGNGRRIRKETSRGRDTTRRVTSTTPRESSRRSMLTTQRESKSTRSISSTGESGRDISAYRRQKPMTGNGERDTTAYRRRPRPSTSHDAGETSTPTNNFSNRPRSSQRTSRSKSRSTSSTSQLQPRSSSSLHTTATTPTTAAGGRENKTPNRITRRGTPHRPRIIPETPSRTPTTTTTSTSTSSRRSSQRPGPERTLSPPKTAVVRSKSKRKQRQPYVSPKVAPRNFKSSTFFAQLMPETPEL